MHSALERCRCRPPSEDPSRSKRTPSRTMTAETEATQESLSTETNRLVDSDDSADHESIIAAAEALVTEEQLLAAARLLETLDSKSSLLKESHRDTLKSAAAFQAAIADLLGQPLLDQPDSDAAAAPTNNNNNTKTYNDNDCWKKQGESHGEFDTAIYYKVDDAARLTCRIDTPIPSSLLVPLLSVLNEVDLYQHWLPSWNMPSMGVTRCEQLAQDGRANQTLAVNFSLPWPYSARQAVIRAVAVDDIDANGWIAVRMQTMETGGVVPPAEKNGERVDFSGAFLFRACPANNVPLLVHQEQQQQQPFKQKHDNSNDEPLVLVSFQMFCDAHLAGVPMYLVNFVTRTVIGHMWAMLLQVAQDVHVGKRPHHKQLIDDKPEFYQWVEDRVQVMLDQQLLEQYAHQQPQERETSSLPLDPCELEFVSYLQG